MSTKQKQPQNVRNFWIELQVDGKVTQVATGPRSADGGFELTVRMRENGKISPKWLSVLGTATADGLLILTSSLSNDDNYLSAANASTVTTR